MKKLDIRSSDPELKIAVSVPDLIRAYCYQPYLGEMIKSLKEKLKEADEKKPIFLKTDTLITDILQGIVSLFDEQVMAYLDKDIKEYVEKYSINIQSISVRQAFIELDQYFLAIGGEENFADYLLNKYPALKALFNRLTENYLMNIQVVLNRIRQDLSLIQKSFAPEPLNKSSQLQIKLAKMTLTQSDRHRQGQQVIILEFCSPTADENKQGGHRFKVVYKPAPVQADALIIGNIQRLTILDEEYKECFSLIEILNPALDLPLPTYLIIPRLDGDPNKIRSHYGYIEYISHQPWMEKEYDLLINQLIEEEKSKGDRAKVPSVKNLESLSERIQSISNHQYVNLLKKAMATPGCDYVTKDLNQITQYSRDCGMLLAIMILAGICDSHYENLFIHQRRPILLDLEECFVTKSPSIRRTVAFDYDIGSMWFSSFSLITIPYILGITGQKMINIKTAEKNRLYYHDEKFNRLISARHGESLINGFEQATKIFTQSEERVQAWFKLRKVTDMIVRVLPAGTATFPIKIKWLRESDFSEQKFSIILKNKLVNLSREYLNNRQQLSEREQKNKEARTAKDHFYQEIYLPNFSIYLSSVHSQNIFSELNLLSIPAYHASISKQCLYDFNNREIQIPELPLQADGDEKDQKCSVAFFPRPPIITLQARYTLMVKDPTILDYLIREIKGKLEAQDELASEGFLPIISLSDYDRSQQESSSPRTSPCPSGCNMQ